MSWPARSRGLLRAAAAVAAVTLVAAALHLGAPARAQGGSVPARPAGLAAAATHDAVVLTWDDPGDASITHYKVHRRIPGKHASGFFVVIEQDTATAATTYTDTGVAPGTLYVYRVTAVNAHGDSQWSRYSSIVTPAAPDPAPRIPSPSPIPTRSRARSRARARARPGRG